MTMNDTWGYKVHDVNWKSTDTLLRTLADVASKGGNFLLNVGPTAEGLIPPESVERLAEMGQWMKMNGEAIYGTTASPFISLPWGRCTTKGNDLYLIVLEWPEAEKDKPATLVLPGLASKPASLSFPRRFNTACSQRRSSRHDHHASCLQALAAIPGHQAFI